MNQQTGLFILGTGAVILLVACAVKGKMEMLLTTLMRGLLGGVGIYFVNGFLAGMGIVTGVGINIFTFLAVGFLGIPGFLGLYVLGIYHVM